MPAARVQSSCLRLRGENLAAPAELQHPEGHAVPAEHVAAFVSDPQVAPSAPEEVLAMWWRAQPQLQGVHRRAELSLTPGHVLAERPGRGIPGLLKRSCER